MGKVKSNYIGTIIESTIGTTTKTLSISMDLLKKTLCVIMCTKGLN